MAKNVKITRVSAIVLVFLIAVCFIPRPAYAAECIVTVGDYDGVLAPSDTFTVPVSISNNPGLYVATFEATYNHNVLQIISIDVNGTMIESSNLVYSSQKPDVIGLFITPDIQVSDGNLFNITFQVKNTATTAAHSYSIKLLNDLPKNFAVMNNGMITPTSVTFQGGSAQVNVPDSGNGNNPGGENPGGGNPGGNNPGGGNPGGGNPGGNNPGGGNPGGNNPGGGNPGGNTPGNTGTGGNNTGSNAGSNNSGTTQGTGTGTQSGTAPNISDATGNVAAAPGSTIPDSQIPSSSGNSNLTQPSMDIIEDGDTPLGAVMDDGFSFSFFPWGLLTLLLVLALGGFFFFIIAKRRKKEDEESLEDVQ